MALFAMLTVVPAHAQYPGGGSGYPGGGYPGGGWSVHDQAGNAINANSDGSGYPLRGPSTGTYNLSGAYPSVLTAAQKPNATTGYAFLPNPNDYQGWLFSSGSTAPGDGYDPFHLWINAAAYNDVGTSGGGVSGYLGSYSTGYQYVNGAITASVGGTLWAVFQWSGANPPDHLDVLLSTTLRASASVSSYGSPAHSDGLSSSATATDSLNETASASGGVPLVTGRHLLRVPVDPSTGKASVSLGGTSTATASNSVLYGAFGNYPGTTSPGYYQVTNGPTGAASSASIGATATPDNRELGISCSAIEPSYYKGVFDSQHGTDRYVHVRQPLGNSVDSVVFLQNDPNTGQHFIASATYASNAVNFVSPKYTWTISGDGKPDGNTSANLNPNPTNPYGLANLPAYLDFGSTWDATKTESNQLSVKVKDADGTDANDTYTVTWHAPQEKFRLISYQKDVPKLVGSLQPITVNATIPSYLTIPGQEGEIDWGSVQQQAGLPVAVAGTGAGGLLLIPELAAGPAGWVIIAGQAVAAAASYKLGTSSPNHPGTVQIQGNADYNEYLADLNHQVAINGGDPGAAGDLVRFKPPLLASQAQAAEMDPAHWTSDPYFMHSTAMWQGGWYTDLKDLEGDGYNVNGYTGHVPAHTMVPTHLFKYFVWTCTYNLPPTH